VSFEIAQAGDDVELVKAILFTDRVVLDVQVISSSKKRVTTRSYKNYADKTITEWRQIVTLDFNFSFIFEGEIREKSMKATCSSVKDIKHTAFQAARNFLKENQVNISR